MRYYIPITSLALLLFVSALVADDKPAKDKAAEFKLLNKAKDICVYSDRDEPMLDYFRRSRILVCTMREVNFKKVFQAKEPIERFLVSSCSQNDDLDRVDTFGSWISIAHPSESVAKLINAYFIKQNVRDPSVGLILRRDAKNPRLYYPVGYIERATRGFFAREEKDAKDGYSPKDMSFQGDNTM